MILDFYYKLVSSFLFNARRKDRDMFHYNTVLSFSCMDVFFLGAICITQNTFGYRSIWDLLDSLVDNTGISQIDAIPATLGTFPIFWLFHYFTICHHRRYVLIMKKYRYDDKRIVIYTFIVSILLFFLSLVLQAMLKD